MFVLNTNDMIKQSPINFQWFDIKTILIIRKTIIMNSNRNLQRGYNSGYVLILDLSIFQAFGSSHCVILRCRLYDIVNDGIPYGGK